MPHIQTFIQAFLDHLKFQKRFSRHTIVSYQNDLHAFFDHLIQQFGDHPLNEIKPAYIKSWLASLKEAGLSSKSINRKISCLKSFFKYQLKQEIITVSPMVTIISPKIGKRLPQYVEISDINTLFNDTAFTDDWSGHTANIVLQIFYNTGIRQAELIALKEHNIDISNCCIKVLGKGSKERVIPVSNILIGALRDYINLKKKFFETYEPVYLLLNEKGKKLTPKYVYLLVNKYLSMVTTIDKKSPHVLRHTFATHLSNSGAQLNAIKELLGHSSLASTQIYTHNSIEKLKDIHKKAHPKA